jgi:hypothetical protein
MLREAPVTARNQSLIVLQSSLPSTLRHCGGYAIREQQDQKSTDALALCLSKEAYRNVGGVRRLHQNVPFFPNRRVDLDSKIDIVE